MASSQEGSRLLFLFGERHSIKPYIRQNLLNTVELCNLGIIACVGVEGRPDADNPDFPGHRLKHEHEKLKAQHGENVEKIIDGLLATFGEASDFLFWKTLRLLDSTLVVKAVDDQELFNRADSVQCQYIQRRDFVARFLNKSSFRPNDPDRVTVVNYKADMQFEYELAEDPANVKRDDKMLENMFELWSRSGTDKAAILNAGSSHIYRIARHLPPDVRYIHVEQP
jgi:hypothetical protein